MSNTSAGPIKALADHPITLGDEVDTETAIDMLRASHGSFVLRVGNRPTECVLRIIQAGGGKVSVEFL